MALTAKRAQQVAEVLHTLDNLARTHDLRVSTTGLDACLVDADGTTVCRLDYDADLGALLAREAY